MKKISMRQAKLFTAAAVMVLGVGAGASAATGTEGHEACCYPVR